MIDLSYLTEEEQANILRVLQRDAELRKVEEKRIGQLQIKNEIQRKNMTGEWFYKAKARRHKDTLHGAELIEASMRRKKPTTIYERLQSREFKEKSNSFLKNAGTSIFIPPELSFFLQPKLEEPQNSRTAHKENRAQPQQQQLPRKTSPSPGKQRENPFNKSFPSADYPNEQERPPLSVGKQSTSMQDKWIPHTDFESPQVSDQQSPEIFQGEDEITHEARKRNPQTKETYKSLQDLNAIYSMPSALDSKNKEIVLSADDVSNIPVSPENTPLQSKKLKRLSQSVPMLAEVSGSIMSIYSGDYGNIDVRGKIQFSLDYVDKLKEFHIFVVRCSDLAAADEKKNRSDPYVKSYLLPDKVKMGKKKTSVKKKSLNPIYNEILRYKVEKNVLMAQTLNLSVWHNDTFGRNDFLGEVDIELEKWNWSNKQMEWYNLKPRTITSYTTDYKGTLKVAFRYIPQGHKGKKTGEVQIWVKEASNLPQVRAHRLDPFVKCYVLPDTSRKSRQKTRVVKKTRNPNFNHTMVYDGFGPEDLKDACVELSVWDHDKLVNHFLGGLRIGLGTGKSYGLAVDWMDSTEEETQVWNKMITNPNMWVEGVLPLRMLMLSKNITN